MYLLNNNTEYINFKLYNSIYMTNDEIRTKLFSSKSGDRRSAAKQIRKANIQELAADLFQAYLKERTDARTWETQTEMIRALGRLGYTPALPEVEAIVQQNKPQDTITIFAACTYVQLQRTSLQDGRPILALLPTGSLSVVSGALYALAMDRMVPPDNEITEIIRLCWNSNKHPDRIGNEYGLMDPRYYLAVACAGWDKKLTTAFLEHCLANALEPNRFGKMTENNYLIEVCQKSLAGKYIKID